MSLILGCIMFIGGIALCFTNNFNAGLVFFSLSSFLIVGWDISASIRYFGEKHEAGELIENVKELNKLMDHINKMNGKD